MAKKAAPALVRPRRTKEHVNASKSHNFMEKFFIDQGHTVDRPTDYGYDVVVTTFDADGYAEGGDIRIQLKASDDFQYVSGGEYIFYKIEIKHYNLWIIEPMPVFLVLYDATRHGAYWVHIQDHFADARKRPAEGAKSLKIRVPVAQVFTEATVRYARERKAEILNLYRNKVFHHD